MQKTGEQLIGEEGDGRKEGRREGMEKEGDHARDRPAEKTKEEGR